ncbi:MAG TPA: D-arabinono-1,4-lactone oxidase [Burkholderiales bacterium]|nr:D-arabinono-1,4-lactone oxidase [Burkholderiales bacterium]
MKVGYRKTWKNHTRNQSIQPLRLCVPETLDDAVQVVKEAEELGCTVRAVGSGHSWSDVALTSGFLVDTSALGRVLDLEPGLLRSGLDSGVLAYPEGGITLRALNDHLDARGRALSNMGGYDAQTMAGVISTATHGSGIAFGPMAESIRSLDLVAGGGRVFRIEPADGPTDPAAFAARYPGRILKQDDDWFRTAAVGMGCTGIIYAVLVAVEPKFWLKEVRVLRTWPEVADDLRSGKLLRDNRHCEIYFNPYRVDGEHRCVVTTRNPVPPPQGLPKDKLERHPLTEIAAALPLVHRVIHFLFAGLPRITPEIINNALESLVDDGYTNVSYKVFNIGAANEMPAYSMEIGVPIERAVDAVERIQQLAEQHRKVGDVYHTSPISLRFVKASPAFMSMMHGRDTMMIELIMMTRTQGGFELLGAHEEALSELGGRPHWGQVNYLAGGHELIRSMYPRFDTWLDVVRQLDPRGTFDSPFTKRVGITRRGFLP